MTTDQEKFLQKYPLFPKSLINKFSELLPIELSKYDDNFSEFKDVYYSVADQIYFNPLINYNSTLSILTPKNQIYVKRYYADYGKHNFFYVPNFDSINSLDSKIYWPALLIDTEWFYQSGISVANASIILRPSIIYDSRLFNLDTELLYDISYNNLPITANALHVMNSVDIKKISISGKINLYGLVKFNGVESLIILHENGIDFDNINYEHLYEFSTFLKSYIKYSGQIENSLSLAKYESNQKLLEYEKILQIKLLDESRNLENLKLQIDTSMQNEYESAKRDYQNLLLNAQDIALTIKKMAPDICL